ncbi:hypothetical protein LOTGIDRAFT_227967 [Lottia gigantea]|uniref:DUF3456 domain-containing protein n=1 Tax=Lottia gigantea TaxID=225164 RepID=V4CS66_LOTGI|nr:hypothetical protein LOTGIDRAFT_227967 [Lottia gigantea]ESP05335.1 hypothetical protein LOTGIDRAFT_227967 [Lottia gigantea]
MDLSGLLIVFTNLLLLVESKKDIYLYCAVCRTLVDEVKWSISQVDPKKTIEVGSFRVDTHGNQARSEIPFAGSHSHLIEVMESICDKMRDYGKTIDNLSRNTMMRIYGREGQSLSRKNIISDSSFTPKIRRYCDTIIEDFEEEIIKVFKDNNIETLEFAICTEIVDVCTSEDLKEPLPVAEDEEEVLSKEEELDKELQKDDEQNYDQNDVDLLEKDREEL